ncbi:MAG: hypothetical protein JNL88_09060 [Bacteroidia bacterium]|nr:hypothetical protein [Bacteroidia bacterium]
MNREQGYDVMELDDFHQWDQLLLLSEFPSPFSTSTWVDGISSLFGYRYKLVAVRNSEMEVALLAVYFKERSGVNFSFHPQLTPYNSPQFIRPSKGSDARWQKEKSAILTCLQQYLQENFVYPYLFLDTAIQDVRPFIWSGWNARPAYTYLVDPGQTKLDPDVQRRYRNCIREGFTVSYNWSPEVFVRLFRLTMDRQHIRLAYSDQRMLDFLNRLKEKNLIWMATSYDKEGAPHASWVQLQVEPWVVFNWNSATNLAFANSGGNSVLVFDVLEKMKAEQVKAWDLCGADTPSVVGFKSKLGGALQVYYKVDFSNYPVSRKILYRWKNR